MIESGHITETVNDAALVTFQRSLEIAVMVTGQSTNKSLNLFSACPPRPTNVAGDNYAADMDNTLKNQFADIESARQFFPVHLSYGRTQRRIPDDIPPPHGWRRQH